MSVYTPLYEFLLIPIPSIIYPSSRVFSRKTVSPSAQNSAAILSGRLLVLPRKFLVPLG